MKAAIREKQLKCPANLNRDKIVGTCVMPDLLRNDATYGKTIENEFNCITVEHHMKWEPLLIRGRGECAYDFTECDFIVDWALSKGIRVKGHTLVWHVTSPLELLKDKSPAQLSESIRRHIHTTCGHFYGRIESWDVVNEALAPSGEFADSFIYNGLGEKFIEDSFRWAKSADPNARLIYNDNKVEDVSAIKSVKMFELCERLKKNHIPLDGVGLQAHFDAAGVGLKRPSTPAGVVETIQKYKQLGLSVNISEMDVRTLKLSKEVASTQEKRDLVQAEIFEETLTPCWNLDNFEGVTFWGFNDAHSWVHKFYYEGDAPLLFKANYEKKPSYYGVLNSIQNCSSSPAPRPLKKWKGFWVPESPTTGGAYNNHHQEQDTMAAKKMKKATDNPDWKLE